MIMINKSYANYTEISNNYDSSRYAVAIDFYNEIITNVRNKNICDMGCGTGNYLIHFAGKAKYICGIDINENMLKIAKSKIHNEYIQQKKV